MAVNLETKWLENNRHLYIGKWVAIEGYELLAVGDTCKEVFEKLKDRDPVPLVIQIQEDKPFAGW